MRYFNTLTKATIDTEFKISGGDWVLENESKEAVVDIQANDADSKKAEQEQVVEESNVDGNYDWITKDQIMQELDAFGVGYDKRANKQVLYDLMMEQGKE
ncbi:hypothetical protein EFO40_04590 [Lactococcus cremoris]|uniref:Phage protein n=1 Tax=Lactococcus lactis subsp. cremoris TaxID=1359 RepID=A0A896TAX7_LACLC|nr:hypothetical protein [Lactococcus cremoris]EQC84261.1 hypothetical protein LLT7_11450 [Lactococcus cremoris subsp. cremoris TIFN7]QGJ84730.1 hypothetical protein [Lactococcus phage proPhi7]ARE26080.1 hypothetical protein LLJM2_1325 [Lactococcus cremoris]MCT4399990.1 hypothetical protein [Lactococcus cremoris]MCT4428798.1 hypothetical protein [Lactococcus cremoris]